MVVFGNLVPDVSLLRRVSLILNDQTGTKKRDQEKEGKETSWEDILIVPLRSDYNLFWVFIYRDESKHATGSYSS